MMGSMTNPSFIDLRSDTVTKPTRGMLEAMVSAELGDDVYHEDPTVNRLEETSAAIVGQEAALFVPTGTMANQVAIMGHCQRGDEVLCGEGAHSFFYETGAGPVVAGVQFFPLPGGGLFKASDLREAVKPPHFHFPRTRLVCVENTMNRAGGRVWPQDEVDRVVAAAHELGLRAHLDGARIFNAQVASGVPAKRLAQGFDSVSFCFSKGLGAPAGSVLCGPAGFINDCRRWRKMLGGGMRQAGILAAACLYALEHHVARLADDHRLAKLFAAKLAEIPGIDIDLAKVESNIFGFNLPETIPAAKFQDELKQRGVLVNILSARRVRGTTHMDVGEKDILKAVEIIREVMKELA